MRKKQWITLVVVLAALAAATAGMKAYKTHQEKAEEEQAEAETIYALKTDADDVTGISYEYEGTSLSFTKSDDTWTYEGDTSIDIDEDAMDTMLSSLCSITADSQIDEPDDVSEYGIDEPIQQAVLTLSDGSQITLTFGAENEILGGYYLQVSDDANVYLVSSTYVNTTLSKSVEDLTAEEEEETEDSEDTDESEEADDASDTDSSDSTDTDSADNTDTSSAADESADSDSSAEE